MSTVGVLVEDVPSAVIAAVDRDSRERDMSRNDVVCEILATRFRVPFTPSGRGYDEAEGMDWGLRMPRTLRDAIQTYAVDQPRKLTQRGVIIATLELHYDLPVTSPRRRPSRPPIDPEIVREVRARAEAGESVHSLHRRFGFTRATIDKLIRT